MILCQEYSWSPTFCACMLPPRFCVGENTALEHLSKDIPYSMSVSAWLSAPAESSWKHECDHH